MGVLGHPTPATQPLGLDAFPRNQPAAGATGAVLLVPGDGSEGVGCKKPPFRMQRELETARRKPCSSKGGCFSFPSSHTSGVQPPPPPLWAEDLMPQALQRGVPSSASLQSGVLWVLQEAQRRGPGESEVKRHRSEARSQFQRPGGWGESRGWSPFRLQ